MGSDLQTIILASSVLYELIGPGCAKLALYLSRSYSTKLEDVAVVAEVTETGEQKSDVQLLIERIENDEVFRRKEVKVWYCTVCGHIEIGTEPPEKCPVCEHPQGYFEIKAENF